MTSYRSILAVGIAAACSTPLGGVDAVFTSSSSSSSSSIFGTSFTGGLVKIDGSTGKLTPEGPDHRDELEGQELSTIDQKHGRYYILGFNATSKRPNLFGWNLKDHSTFVDIELDLSESAFVGVGQALDADPTTGDLFIVGRTDRVLPNSTTHDVLRFHANTTFQTSERIATLHGIDILDGSSAYDHVNGVEYVGMIASGTPPNVEFNIFAVDVHSGKVTTIKQDATHGKFVQNLDFDSSTERVYGFGVDPATSPPSRSLVYLDSKTHSFHEVTDVPKLFYMEDGNLVTLDEHERIYYALLTEGQQNVTTWKDSDKCIGCTGSPAQCCYDPAQGPSSYSCFAVNNCSQISDSSGPDLTQPFHLFGMHIDTGVIVSKSPPVCALQTNGTYPACPWTIESAQ